MKNRLAVVGTFASLAALILLAVVVWKFGTKDPSPPSLSKHPDAAITGEILYIRGECIVRAAASGASKQTVSCPAPNGVSWVDARTARYWRFGPGVPTAVDVDLATGAESLAQVPPGTSPPTGWDMVSPRGETASFDKDGSLYRSTPGEAARVLIFEYDGPESRRPEFLTWSPDGEWVLLFYPAKEYDRGELWIVRRDGTSAGTLAGGVARSASWWIDGKGFLPALQ